MARQKCSICTRSRILMLLIGLLVAMAVTVLQTQSLSNTSVLQSFSVFRWQWNGEDDTAGNQLTSEVKDDCPTACSTSCVPRNLHYVWFSKEPKPLRFHHLIALLGALRFFRPRRIYFVHDTLPEGEYWDYFLTKLPETVDLRLVQRSAPTEVFGRPVKLVEHQSDVARLQSVMEHGGLYVDTDQVLVRSLDPLLCHSTVMGLEGEGYLSNGFILAKQGAMFIRLWYSHYRDFTENSPAEWGKYSIYVPWMLAKHNPTLIHVEHGTINRPNAGVEMPYLFTPGLYYNLTNNYAVHLWYRNHNVEYTPDTIRNLTTTLGRVFRYIYFEEPFLER